MYIIYSSTTLWVQRWLKAQEVGYNPVLTTANFHVYLIRLETRTTCTCVQYKISLFYWYFTYNNLRSDWTRHRDFLHLVPAPCIGSLVGPTVRAMYSYWYPRGYSTSQIFRRGVEDSHVASEVLDMQNINLLFYIVGNKAVLKRKDSFHLNTHVQMYVPGILLKEALAVCCNL